MQYPSTCFFQFFLFLIAVFYKFVESAKFVQIRLYFELISIGLPVQVMSRQFLNSIILASALFILILAPQAIAGESNGLVRGRLLDENGAPLAGVKVASTLENGELFEAITDNDGTYALKAVIGRKSVKFKVGLNLFGLTTKTQQKEDIRVREVEIAIGDGRNPLKTSVPVFFANLPAYSVYLYDVVVPNSGTPYYRDAQFFTLDGVNLSTLIVKEREPITVEVPVRVPPYPELAAGMRVVIRGGLFGEKGLKAFDNGKDGDRIRGDGIYTAIHKVNSKGPFGFYLVSADVLLPELSAVFKPGEAWPVMFTSISTSEAGGRYERVTEIYSIGGVETGLSAEWYYYCNERGGKNLVFPAFLEAERLNTRNRWYGEFARAHLDRASAPLFVCRGMVEFRAAVALSRTMQHYDSGDYEMALKKLEDARKTAPDYESIPLWEALVKHAMGDVQGAIDAISEASEISNDPNLKIVFAELCREAGDSKSAVRAYLEAFRDLKDPQILRTAAHYMYELGDYASAQKAFDALKIMMNRSAYGYGFMMYGEWDFPRRFALSSMRAEQYLFREFAAPESAWQRESFEEAFIFGSLSGWKAARTSRKGAENARKYSAMLRIAGMYDEALAASDQIGGAAGTFELALIYLDMAGAELKKNQDANPAIVKHSLKMAAEELMNVYADNQENAAVNYNLALALYLGGDALGALSYCESAIDTMPRWNEARFLMANIYEELGKTDDAINQWQWFADASPEGAVKILAFEHLESLKKAAAKNPN